MHARNSHGRYDFITRFTITPSNNFDASLQRFSICLPPNDAYSQLDPRQPLKLTPDRSIISDFIGHEITRTIWQFAATRADSRSCNRGKETTDDSTIAFSDQIAWPSICNAHFDGKLYSDLNNLTHERTTCFRIMYNAMYRADKIKTYMKNISNN